MNIGTVKKSRLLSFVCLLALLAVVAAASPASAVDLTIGSTTASANGNFTPSGSYTWDDANGNLTLTGPINTTDAFVFSTMGVETVTITINGSVTLDVSGTTPAIAGDNVHMRIQGSNTGKTDTLTLISAQNDALRLLGHGNPSGSNLTVQDIKLKAAGHSPTSKAASPGRGGYAGIWVTGSVTIGDADVEASGISEVNEDDAVFGILAGSSITIQGNSVVVADGNQTGTPNGGRAAGIFSMNGSIMTNATSSVPKVTATAVSASAAAAGIYSEYGSVYITGTTVEATAESKSGGTDKNEGIGIAAGGAIEIYATSTVNATGTSARGESAGIAAAVPGNDSTITTPAGNVKIQGNATVTAEGVGGEGHGIVVEKAGNVEIGTGATVTATAHGTGYAIETATGTITNNGTATLMADDETHYSNTTIGGTGTTTESPNTPPPPPARSSRGGCDAGFGSFAALFALGMSLAIRRKRP